MKQMVGVGVKVIHSKTGAIFDTIRYLFFHRLLPFPVSTVRKHIRPSDDRRQDRELGSPHPDRQSIGSGS
jgi:hypothetical protein